MRRRLRISSSIVKGMRMTYIGRYFCQSKESAESSMSIWPMVKRNNISARLSIWVSMLTFIACGNNNGNANRQNSQETPAENHIENIPIIEEKHYSAGIDLFFTPAKPIADLIEADSDLLRSCISRTVDLGNGVEAIITIANGKELGLIGSIDINNKIHILYPPQDTNLNAADMMTVFAYDLDRDGIKEILVHNTNGDMLSIFRVESFEPVFVGSIGCNNSFFVTDDGIIVCTFGSQGLANRARYYDGKLEQEEIYIDKVLQNSKDYLNLRYLFDDNENDCRKIDMIYPADRYIICDQDSINGNNSLTETKAWNSYIWADRDGVKDGTR